MKSTKETDIEYDTCEECGEITPLSELGADGYRCKVCDPDAVEREGPVT